MDMLLLGLNPAYSSRRRIRSAPLPPLRPLRLLFFASAPRAPKSTMAGGSLAPGQTGAGPPDQRKRKAPAGAGAAVAEDEVEAEELESEVADLDRRTLEHLRRTATRLPDAAFSRLAALRPTACLEVPAVSEISIAEDDQELEKVKILKSKIKANISDLPKVLEQINETTARCEKLCWYPSCVLKEL